jgi:tRNA threonylcarbamoyl adenosine modification protein YeaZ
MITLGIELSSRQGSVALLRDGALLAEKTWIGEHVRHGALFQTLETLLNEAGAAYSDISLYAVGRGPGSFSGMRMAFAVAQALALPGKTEVRAVSSGAALALAVARETGIPQIAVAGDARRGQFWFGQFSEKTGGIFQTAEWKLVPYEELHVASETLLVSPEAERLVKWFPDIGMARFPSARYVAELASTQSEPPEPLYMHPPVFVEPKYD